MASFLEKHYNQLYLYVWHFDGGFILNKKDCILARWAGIGIRTKNTERMNNNQPACDGGISRHSRYRTEAEAALAASAPCQAAAFPVVAEALMPSTPYCSC